MPPDGAEVLGVTQEQAPAVGARLWRASYVRQGLRMPEYAFEPFPGTPVAEMVVALTQYYRYQTRNDDWDQPSSWTDGRPPFEARFVIAQEWYALALLGFVSRSRVLDV